MKYINIFVFWLGDNNTKIDITKKFEKLFKNHNEIKLNIGPSKEDHEYLLNNFKFYKNNYEKKRFAFCSDLYRVWKLSNNDGIYIDAATKINMKKFDEFLQLYKDNKLILFRESGHLMWNGILASKNHNFFEQILDFYKYFSTLCNTQTGPLILANYTYKNFGCKFKTNDVLFLNATDIDPYATDSFFNYNGMGSWQNKSLVENKDINNSTNQHGLSYFHKSANYFKRGYKKSWIIIRWCLKHDMLIHTPYVRIKKSLKHIKK